MANFTNHKREIFEKYLQEVATIKFTFREIEVIACILHNRGEKKIAELLSAHPRTISTHVRNIMNKLGYNSRDSIIDAIEKSGTLFYFRKFYLQILLQSCFEKQLKKIRYLVTQTARNYDLYYFSISDQGLALIKQLKEQLKLSNIDLIEHKLELKQNPLADKASSADQIIYFVEEQIPAELAQQPNIIFISSEQSAASDSKSEGTKCIDFSDQSNYHLAILQLIVKLTNSNLVTKIIEEFSQEYVTLKSSWQEAEIQPVALINRNNQQITSKLKKYITGALVILVMIGLGMHSNSSLKMFLFSNSSNAKSAQLVKNLEDITNGNEEKLASSVLLDGNFIENYSLVKQIEQLVTPDNKKLFEYYFSNPKHSTKLLKLMYSFYAAAVFYNNRNDNSFTESIKILEFTKDIIENYLKNLNKVPYNFASLARKELLSELKIFPGLPEMYTKIIYILGKSYMHSGEVDKAKSLFKISKYLGKHLKLIQGPFSDRSGFMKLEQHEAFTDAKNGNYNVAKDKLLKLIKSYQQYQHNAEQFISYNPFRKNKLIKLNEDPINIVTNATEITKCYAKLILITDDQNQRAEYINLMLDQYLGSKLEVGIFNLIEQVNHRKKADVYIDLANNLLQLHSNKIGLEKIKDKLNQIFKLGQIEDLDFIEKIFKLVIKNSRKSETQKLVGYEGLLTLNQQRLAGPMNLEQKNEVLKMTAELEEKIITMKKELNVHGHIIGITPINILGK